MAPSEYDREINRKIQSVFLQFFVDSFKDYSDYISFMRKYPEPVTIFNKAKFVKDHPDAVAFLSVFVETQAFAYFLEKHHQLPFSLFNDVRLVVIIIVIGSSLIDSLIDWLILDHRQSWPTSLVSATRCISRRSYRRELSPSSRTAY